MQKRIRAAACGVMASLLWAGTATADSAAAFGAWTAPGPSGALPVIVGPCGYAPDRLCAQVDPSAGSAFAGETLVTGMSPDGAGRWVDGQVRPVPGGPVYHGRMALDPRGLLVEACTALVCRPILWSRIAPAEGAPAPWDNDAGEVPR